ncbi:MAG: DUF4402 domain-containing protein [Croceibacterium sp.]
MGPEIFRQVRHAARRLRGAVPLAAALACLALAAPAQAQVIDSETAEIRAAILDPGSIANVADMDFGQIIPGNGGGAVIMSAAATPTCTVTGSLVHSGACRSAQFSIRGIRQQRVRIRITNGGSVILTGPGGATMTLNSISILPVGMTSVNGGNGWNLGNYRIDTVSGMTDFYLGGRLNVAASQAAGVYNGTIDIQIQFN